jgi:hypothetical protein
MGMPHGISWTSGSASCPLDHAGLLLVTGVVDAVEGEMVQPALQLGRMQE